MIRPGTSQLFYPPTKTGIISLNLNEQIELYCSTNFATPSGAGTTVLATCSSSNQFVYNNNRYDFKSFACTGFTASQAKKTSTRCYNNGYIIEHGFPVGSKFVKIYEACHNDVREETYYVKHAFTPANAGYQSGILSDGFYQQKLLTILIISLFRLRSTKLCYWWTFWRQRCRQTLYQSDSTRNHRQHRWIVRFG